MNILMFGWEFPPNISGGLGTACYGITKSLANSAGIRITFVIPKAQGNEPSTRVKLIGANDVDLIKSKIKVERLKHLVKCYTVDSKLIPYQDPKIFKKQVSCAVEKISKLASSKSDFIQFSGKYGTNLMDEIHNFSVIGEYIASQTQFDLIHAHDWLTFPAGIAAKKISGKPLVIHVHATDFDRSGGKVNKRVFAIEKEGMQKADRVICVSNLTRRTVIEKYNISPSKTYTVHNGVEFNKPKDFLPIPSTKGRDKLVTFLGRITLQKGPEYFVQVAELVLKKMNNVKFIMAGSGDLFDTIISKVAKSHIADRFLFTGFLKGDDVFRMMKLSDVFVMPSVSEPFGICPLEAMQSGVPAIISRQSGVAEVVKHTIKVNFWDTKAMADAIHALLTYPALSKMMIRNGHKESNEIKWEHTATKIKRIYEDLINSSDTGQGINQDTRLCLS